MPHSNRPPPTLFSWRGPISSRLRPNSVRLLPLTTTESALLPLSIPASMISAVNVPGSAKVPYHRKQKVFLQACETRIKSLSALAIPRSAVPHWLQVAPESIRTSGTSTLPVTNVTKALRYFSWPVNCSIEKAYSGLGGWTGPSKSPLENLRNRRFRGRRRLDWQR